jgi:hypothetical protein
MQETPEVSVFVYEQNGTPTGITSAEITDSTEAGRALLTAANAAEQRAELGLGTAALSDAGDFAPLSHNHSIANVTGLQTALDGKANLAGGNAFTGNQTITGNLDVVDVAPIFGGSRTANADKAWRPRVPDHSGARFVSPLFVFNEAAANRVNIGGGTSTADAATELSFYTGPTVNTPNGTLRLRINNAGAIGLSGANFGTSGQVLVSAGSAAPPVWGAVAISGVTGLQTALDGKAETSAVTTALSGKIDIPASSAQGDILYRGASAWERLPAGTSGQVLLTNGAGANPTWGNAITLGAAVNSTSGTAFDFTDIPAGVNRVTVHFVNVSTNGTSDILIQIGTSGGVEDTEYLGASIETDATPVATQFTTGFGLEASGSGNARHGSVTLNRVTGNTWAAAGTVALSNAASVIITAGSKTLAGQLDRVRVTTVGGSQAFDLGVIGISWGG